MSTQPVGPLLSVTFAGQGTADLAGYPENPTSPIVLVTFSRWVTAKPTMWQPGVSNLQSAFEQVTMTLNPLHFEYTESVNAMSELRITVPDSEYELINHRILEEDLATDVTVRFGYLEGANMSPEIKMVFYKQEPEFPADGAVQTTLVCYDQMIFFTLPFEPTTLEHPQGITIQDMVKLVTKEVMRAYGRTLSVQFDGHDFNGKWWRMHQVGKENVKAPNTKATTTSGRTTVAKTKVGTPLEFLYGLLRLAQSTTTDEPIELFVQNDALFFRPANLKDRKVIAHFRYFSELGVSKPQYNRLISFRPQVETKPSMVKVRTVDQETKTVEEAVADNDTPMDRTNMTPKQNTVFRTDIQGGGTVEVRAGGRTGDRVGKQAQDTQQQKSYTVKRGDSLDGIAKRLGVSADLLITWNHLTPDGSTDRAKVVLKPSTALTYYLPTPKPSAEKAEPDNADSTPTVLTQEQQAHANRAYLTEEYKGVKAQAVVEGHPALRAGWPIYIDNVGDRWEGPWYMEEVKHTSDENGYICELSLSRDGFLIAREAGDNSGYDASQDFTDEDPTAPVSAATQVRQKVLRTGIQGGGTAVVNTP
jgi:LysM repeat protein